MSSYRVVIGLRTKRESGKRVAMERGEPIPEPPKHGWSDLRDSVSRTMNSVKRIRWRARIILNRLLPKVALFRMWLMQLRMP